MNNSYRILVIGIDALSYNTIKNNINELKFFYKIINDGLLYRMHSTTPPLSPAAWTSIATGLWPQRHGIYDFQTIINSKIHISSITLKLKGQAFWDFTTIAKKKTIVIGYPFTYPPYPIYGIFVSGFPTPMNKVIAKPETIERTLRNLNYTPDIAFKLHIQNVKKLRHIFKKLIDDLKNHFEILMYFLDTNLDWKLFMYVIPTLDRIQHILWFDKNFIKQIYKLIDDYLNKIYRLYDIDIFVISDHGFEELKYYVNMPKLINKLNNLFYLNKRDKLSVFEFVEFLHPKIIDMLKRIINQRLFFNIKGSSYFVPIAHNTICINRYSNIKYNNLLNIISSYIKKLEFIRDTIILDNEKCIVIVFKDGYEPDFSPIKEHQDLCTNKSFKLKTGTHEGLQSQHDAVFAFRPYTESNRFIINKPNNNVVKVVDVMPTLLSILGINIKYLDIDGKPILLAKKFESINIMKKIQLKYRIKKSIKKIKKKK